METSRKGSDRGKKTEDCIPTLLKKNLMSRFFLTLCIARQLLRPHLCKRQEDSCLKRINMSVNSEAELRAEIL